MTKTTNNTTSNNEGANLQQLAEELKRGYEAERIGQTLKNFKYWEENESDRFTEYLTPKKAEAYKAGTMSRAEAIEEAKKKAGRQDAKNCADKFALIDEIMSAPDVLKIDISVEWVRSRTWGANPHARVVVETAEGCKVYEGSASGCGYDKQSASIAQALNQSASVKKLLYKEKAQNQGANNHELLGYGSGYGFLPYFEGGCGVSSIEHILKGQGLEETATSWGESYNYYQFKNTGNREAVRNY